MLCIRINDNDFSGSPLTVSVDGGISSAFAELPAGQKSDVREALDSINNVSLKELEERGAIVFPSRSVEGELGDGGKIICSVQGLETDRPVVKTTNVMGFFGLTNGVQVSIRSRFDTGERQFFLHYMLRKVCSVSPTVELTHSEKDLFYEFIVYLFPSFLKKAVSQGLFRAYVNREHNDANVRGVINFPRHFRHNIPFSGKIAYRTREYSGDNSVTQLVRHTIEYIAEIKELKNILSLDDEMEKSVQLVRGSTESYDRAARTPVINKNLRPVSHPYYTEYEPLRKLCVRILTHDRVSYGASRHDQVNGILFDGASLWEEYLNVVLKEQMRARKIPLLLEHPNNRTGEGRKYLFETESGGRKTAIFPDFVLKSADEGKPVAILDAKYKHLEESDIPREDCFQALSYMYRFGCNRGVLMYPHSYKDKTPVSDLYLAGHEKSVSLSTVGLDIPEYDESDSMRDFTGRMAVSERLFADYMASHGIEQPVQRET